MVIVVNENRQVTGKATVVYRLAEEHRTSNEALFLPWSLIEEAENHSVYFDLEGFAFFDKAKEMIQKASKPKGVFRMRRLLEKLNKRDVAADVFVLSKLFGTHEHIFVKESKGAVEHMIITINFGNGTMAHLDYTTAEEEFVELEWSGNGQIIEFNSDAMNPFRPRHYTKAPLMYDADVIMKNARSIDGEVRAQLDDIYEQITGGKIE